MSNETWKPRKLNELGFVGRGKSKHRPRNAPELYGGPYPFIQTANIMASELYINSYSKTYSELGLAQSKMWKKGTLCMTIAGENTAETAILGIDACFPDSVVAFIPSPELSDVRFVKYYLDTMKTSFKSVSRGATQDNLSLDKLLSFDLFVPDVVEQRKIADVLSAYDDLIEVNARRIRVLEAMAQSVYREWFGNVDAKSLPRGWSVKELGQIVEMKNGKAIEAEDTGDFPVYGSNGIIGRTNEARYQNAIVIGRVGAYCGSINYCSSQFSASDNTIIASPMIGSGIGENFIYRLLQNMGLRRFAGGAAQPLLTQTDVKRLEILAPPLSLCNKYEGFAESLFSQQTILEKANANLRRTRDLLLPRLVSGEVGVEGL